MGLSFSGGSTSGTSNSTTASNQTKTFSPGQTSLQDQLGTALASDLSASTTGTLSPGVQAEETQAADQINQTSSGLLDRLNRNLAARGFGSSGNAGKAAIQGEIAREGNLANNAANFAGVQQNVNSSNLLAALNYALTQMGTAATGSTSASTTGSNFGWGAQGAVAFGG